jgi:hypothetical protein
MTNLGLQIIKYKEKLLNREWLVNKFLPVFSAVFFLITKLFFNFLLWKDRLVLPNPGDSLSYTRWIRLISESKFFLVPGYTGYSFILGNLAKIFSLSPEGVFRLSFWLGIPLLTIILWKLFKALKFKPVETALCFVLLAFYTGNGSFHGFYWVVPTFFCVALFLYLFASIISEERNNCFLIVLAAIFMPLMHGMGIFACLIFGLYLFLELFIDFLRRKSLIAVFKNNLLLIKKILAITLICVISYVGTGILLKSLNKDVVKENDKIMMSSDIFTDSRILDGSMNNEKSIIAFKFLYLNKIVPHWVTWVAWLLMFFVLLYYKRYKITLFLIATFIFCTISSLIYYKGFRSLVFLWPLTYIFVGSSFYYIWRFIKEKIFIKLIFKNVILGVFVIVIMVFCVFNAIYSLWYIDIMNRNRNFNYNQEMFNEIVNKYSSDEINIYASDGFMIAGFLNMAYEKNYNIYFLPSVSYINQMKPSENKKTIIMLSDDKIFKPLENDSVWGKILKKVLSPITSLETASGESGDKIWIYSINDKIKNFNIPLDSKNQKVLYQDDLFYIFELVDIMK